MKNTRSNSAIELLRIVLLFFLIITHSYFVGIKIQKYIDVQLIHKLSNISVTAFVAITGIFIYKKNSKPLLSRNISRLIFIIIISIILATSVFVWLGKGRNIAWNTAIFTGGRDVWYLYAILPIYFLAPFLKIVLNKYNMFLSTIIGGTIILLLLIARNFGFFGYRANQMLGKTAYGSVYLFGVSILSYGLSKFRIKNVYLLLTTAIVLVFYITNIFMPLKGPYGRLIISGEHLSLLNIILALSVVMTIKNIKWENKYVNWASRRSYFVYEYHWLVQMIWMYYFGAWASTNNHIAFYASVAFIFFTSFILSLIISAVQFNIWNRFTNKYFFKMQKIFENTIKLNPEQKNNNGTNQKEE